MALSTGRSAAADLEEQRAELATLITDKKSRRIQVARLQAEEKNLEDQKQKCLSEKSYSDGAQRSPAFITLRENFYKLPKKSHDEVDTTSPETKAFFAAFVTQFGEAPLNSTSDKFKHNHDDYEAYLKTYESYSFFRLEEDAYRTTIYQCPYQKEDALKLKPISEQIEHTKKRIAMYAAFEKECMLKIDYCKNWIAYFKGKPLLSAVTDMKHIDSTTQAKTESIAGSDDSNPLVLFYIKPQALTPDRAIEDIKLLEAEKERLKKQNIQLGFEVFQLHQRLEAIPRDLFKVIDDKLDPISKKMQTMPMLESEEAFITFFEKNFGPEFLNKDAFKIPEGKFFPRIEDYYEYMDAYSRYVSIKFDVITSAAKKPALVPPSDNSSKEIIAYYNRRITYYQICLKEYERRKNYLSTRIQFELDQVLAYRKQPDLLALHRAALDSKAQSATATAPRLRPSKLQLAKEGGLHGANPNTLLPPKPASTTPPIAQRADPQPVCPPPPTLKPRSFNKSINR